MVVRNEIRWITANFTKSTLITFDPDNEIEKY